MPGTANPWDVALNMASIVPVFKAIHSSEITHIKWKETSTMIMMDQFSSFLRKLGLYIRKVLNFF